MPLFHASKTDSTPEATRRLWLLRPSQLPRSTEERVHEKMRKCEFGKQRGADGCVRPGWLARGAFGEMPDKSQAGLTACAAGEAVTADTLLNDAYRMLMSKLGNADQMRLREAERAWVLWRNKECLMRTDSGMQAGGTIAPTLLSLCDRDIARERAAFLHDLLSCLPE